MPPTREARAHLVHVFPSFDMGGVPIRIAGIIGHLGSVYRHSIIALDGRRGCASRIAAGIEVVYPQCQGQDGWLPRRVVRAGRVVAGLRPDALLTYNWGAMEWALAHRLFGRCPHIHLESGFGVEEARQQLRRRVLFRRLALAGIEHLVVPSYNLASIAEQSWGLDRDRIEVIPNGVDWRLFQEAAKAVHGRTRNDGVVFGTVAPLRREKNLARLLHAFAAFEPSVPVQLSIVGDGPERAGLEQLSARLGLVDRVTFHGHRDAVQEHLARFDVFVMSSDTEQMPNSLIQAMAAGLPVVATDVGDIKTIVADENADLIVRSGDHQAYRAALERLARDHELRRQLGARNLERVRSTFPQEKMFAAYRALLEAVVR